MDRNTRAAWYGMLYLSLVTATQRYRYIRPSEFFASSFVRSFNYVYTGGMAVLQTAYLYFILFIAY